MAWGLTGVQPAPDSYNDNSRLLHLPVLLHLLFPSPGHSLLLPMFPSSGVPAPRSSPAAQDGVCDGGFLVGECLSPDRCKADSWHHYLLAV